MKFNGIEPKNAVLGSFISDPPQQVRSFFYSVSKRQALSKFKFASVFLIFFATSLQRAIAQPLSLSFNSYSLVSGTDKAVNAKYLFPSVTSTLDCYVTITQIYNNAVLTTLDNNTTSKYGGTQARFQPIISIPVGKSNTTSYIKFHFQLVNKGTTTNYVPTHMLWFRAYDIDGNGDDYGLKEFVETGNSFIGAWPDVTTKLVSQTAITTGGNNFGIKTSNSNGNNISDDGTFAYNAFLYANTTGAWDVIGGSNVANDCPSVTHDASNIGDGDRLNSWDFTSTFVSPGADFGDMPVLYEKESSVLNPAYHIVQPTAANVTVYLGTYKPDVDLDPIPGTAANSDDANGVDNGFSTSALNSYAGGNFTSTIKAVNTSGSPAYIYGYIDFNGDGVFDSKERSNRVTVPNGSGTQTLNITFPAGFTYTHSTSTKFARFRIGSVDAEVATPNGKASNGEVEDYALSSVILPVANLSLSANQQNGLVKLTLLATGEERVSHYNWQQSTDGITFSEIGTSPYQANSAASNTYLFNNSPNSANNVIYYRVVEYDLDGNTTISNVTVVKLSDKLAQISLMPTLIADYTNIKVQSTVAENLTLHVMNSEGKMVMAKMVPISAGSNTFSVDGFSKLANGNYYIQVLGSETKSILKVVVQH